MQSNKESKYSQIQIHVKEDAKTLAKKAKKSAETPEKPGDPGFLGFSLLFWRWKAWKRQESMEKQKQKVCKNKNPGFPGKLEIPHWLLQFK